MSEIIRLTREAGQIANVVELPEGGFGVIIGESSVGDYLYPPKELGGGERRIVKVERGRCPVNGGEGGGCPLPARWVYLADTGHFDGLVLVECSVHNFMWCQPRKPEGSGT